MGVIDEAGLTAEHRKLGLQQTLKVENYLFVFLI